jgi:polysaccharide export outer membrane protein
MKQKAATVCLAIGQFLLMLGCTAIVGLAQTGNALSAGQKYVLGPDDQITVRALGVDEIDGKTARVDFQGFVDLPLIGKVKVAGSTVDGVQTELASKLRKYVRDPQVSVSVSEYHSQPVSVLGAVNTPGAYNLAGPSTLEQVLSRAGGLRNDAGSTITITRGSAWGPIPLPSDKVDASGKFSTAQVNVKSLLQGKKPEDNITIEPTDVIAVPRAELVYVVGAVHRPGGFVLNERESMSVLQAVSMSEGLDKTSAPKNAKIIREGTTNHRVEIPVNVSKILSGRSPDVPLLADDILFVPTNAAKSVALRAVEAALQAGTFAAGYAVIQ